MGSTAEEAARLDVLRRYDILDTGPEEAFDDLVRLAARVCGTPIAMVSLVDAARQWFKARVGIEAAETSRDLSFCAHAILGEGLFVIPDAAVDARFAANPLVTADPNIRFYAGSPLVAPGGHAFGTLCVIDTVPRDLTPEQAGALASLGRQVVAQLELRKALADAGRAEAEARDSEARKGLVLDAVLDAIIMVDRRGMILEFNRAAERILGYSRPEAIGRPVAELIVPWDGRWHSGGETADDFPGSLGDTLGDLVEVAALRKGDEVFPAELSITAGLEGASPVFVAHLRDITARKQAEETRRSLAAIVESSGDAIIAKDLAGVITSWNGAATRIFGYTADEAMGRHVSLLVPEDRAAEMDRVLERVRGGNRVDHFETRRRTKDGRDLDVSLTVSPICDAAGRIVGASKVARDITDRKRMEEALRRSEAEARRLAMVASRTDNAVIITDAAGRIEWVNDGFARITGYASAEVTGRRPGSFLQGPATDPETVRRIRERLRAGEGFADEIVNYGKSGREYWLAIDVQPIRDENGVLTNFIAIESDITMRRNAEAQLRRAHDELESRVSIRTAELAAKAELLRRAEEDYRGIFENAFEGIYQTSPEGRYLRANPALARMYGYENPGELIAKLSDVGRQLYVDPVRREEFLHSIEELGTLVGFESQVRCKDGRVIWVSENARAVRDGDGAVIHYEGIVADITDRRRAEEEIRSLNDELATAYDATIEGWAKALDLRDKETEGHTRRVTEMSVRLARSLGLGEEAMVHIRRGALLHDIGKLGVPDSILLKAGPLTEDEWAVMRRHPSNARDWLDSIPVLRPALAIPYSHHEKWDGTGYPQGLAGEDIPLAARLFAAVDVWDALRSDRPYRAGWSESRVHEHLRSLAGTHLDPVIVEAFLKILADAPSSAGDFGGAAPLDVEAGAALSVMTARQPEATVARRKRRLARKSELLRENARLAELAATDDLTGLRNRRHFREALQKAFEIAVPKGRPLSLVILDLDGFKAYNDRHGHPEGDLVLCDMADILRSQTRLDDVVARYGGEEFAALLPMTDASGGTAWAEQLRSAMAAYRWPRSPVTASLGVSTLTADTLSAAKLIDQADRAMYYAKGIGRDRVAHFADQAASGVGSCSISA